MPVTRRDTLQLGRIGLAGLGATTFVPFRARAAGEADSYKTDSGAIGVMPLSHASFVMTTPGLTIYNDPVGGKELYDGQPAADLILITHEHGDHYDADTLAALAGPDTKLVVNPAVMAMLSDDLKARATELANGGTTTVGDIAIEAVPAYNTTEDRLKYHPKGRDNGYVLTIDGKRIYIAGDTEDIPEMRALKDIYVAFVPMNLPFTMDTDQAASAVSEFKPAYAYPYHYKGSDPQAFAEKVSDGTEVVMGSWYPEA